MLNLDGQETGPSLGVSVKTCNTKTNSTIFQLTGVHGIRRDGILENSINLFPLNDSDVWHKCFNENHSFQACFVLFFLCVHIVCNKQRKCCIRARAAMAVNVIRCVLFQPDKINGYSCMNAHLKNKSEVY